MIEQTPNRSFNMLTNWMRAEAELGIHAVSGSVQTSVDELPNMTQHDLDLYGYIEDLRLSDPSQVPSQSRRLHRRPNRGSA